MGTTRELNDILQSGEIGDTLLDSGAALLMAGTSRLWQEKFIDLHPLVKSDSDPTKIARSALLAGGASFLAAGNAGVVGESLEWSFTIPASYDGPAAGNLVFRLFWLNEKTDEEYSMRLRYGVVRDGTAVPALESNDFILSSGSTGNDIHLTVGASTATSDNADVRPRDTLKCQLYRDASAATGAVTVIGVKIYYRTNNLGGSGLPGLPI